MAAPPTCGAARHQHRRRERARGGPGAACGGGCKQQHLTHCRTPMPPSPRHDLRERSACAAGIAPAASGFGGEHGARRWPRAAGDDAPYASERRERPARAAQERRNRFTAAIQPDRSRRPLNTVSGCKLDLLTTNFVHFTSSEVALPYEPGGKGQPPAAISSWALGATREQIARPREGGFIGRVLHLSRSTRPSNPSSTPA